MAKKPDNFDGIKFCKKYNLTVNDFYAEDGDLICPSLPNLKDKDLQDCVTAYEKPTVHEFDLPIKAPDFVFTTPNVNENPELALDEAIAEMENMENGEVSYKSIALISLSVAKYLKSKK